MFDKIFGSNNNKEKVRDLEKRLKEKNDRLKDLEKQVEKLRRDLKKERDRAKEAITEKQRVDKELKDTKQKIETLEDRISRVKEKEERERNFKRVVIFSREDALIFLDELKSFRTEKNFLLTQYFSDPKKAKSDDMAKAVKSIDSKTGYVGFQDELEIFSFVLVPPFPVENDFFRNNLFHTEKVNQLLNSDLKILFLSLHSGKSCVGFMVGPEIKDFKIIRSSVKSKHSKGGFSQGRFERGRKKQIREHIKSVLEYLEDLKYDDLDYVVLDGNERIIGEIVGNLPFDCSVINRNLDISEISKKNSDEFSKEIWSTRVYIM